MFLIYMTTFMKIDFITVEITLLMALTLFILDYLIPSIALALKRFVGTNTGIMGSIVGLILGIIFQGPLSIII